MLIALLVVLGVNLIVLVVFVVAILGRRRWLSHRDGAFAGIAHAVDGEVYGLGGRQRRGYGRWVRDVFIWAPAPFYLRAAIAPIDRVEACQRADRKVRRLGDAPRVITLVSTEARIAVYVRERDQTLVQGPFATVGPAVQDPAVDG